MNGLLYSGDVGPAGLKPCGSRLDAAVRIPSSGDALMEPPHLIVSGKGVPGEA